MMLSEAFRATDASTILKGCTAGLVALGRTKKGVFVLSMEGGAQEAQAQAQAQAPEHSNPENRWTLPFARKRLEAPTLSIPAPP